MKLNSRQLDCRPHPRTEKGTRISNDVESTAARRAAKVCLVGGLLALALWIDRHLLAALIWAGILAIATSPILDRIARKYPSVRDGALLPSLFATLFALTVLIPLGLILVEAARERADVLQWAASARAHGIPTPLWVQQLPVGADAISRWWQANLASPGGASAELNQLNSSAVQHGRLWGGEVVRRVVVFALALVAYFFLLKEQATIVSQLRIAGDRMLGPTGERVARQLVLSVRGTINGLVFVGIGEGVVMTAVYWIAGAPHPFLLGAITAVAAMIPFGAILVFVVAALLILGQGSALAASAVLVIGLVVVGIADHFVRPALIGGATRLPFLLVLFGILGGVETFGLLGLFVGPGVMAALVLLWREYVGGPPLNGVPATRRKRRNSRI